MSSHVERCPACIAAPLAARVNGFTATVYLECDGCGYVELVQRRPDPKPSIAVTYLCGDGTYRTRLRLTNRKINRRRKSA